MAHLIIDVDTIVVSLSPLERLEAMHGDVIVRRSAVTRARVVPDGMAEVRGVRAPGTGIPGVSKVGVWRNSAGRTFAACHGRRPAIVIDLAGAGFDRLVVTTDDPAEIVSALIGPPPATPDAQR
jgi:hypothetical protein